ncbi:MAG: hypothetical protein ABEJ02_04305 [Candidatus Paceibacteria bacterium]
MRKLILTTICFFLLSPAVVSAGTLIKSPDTPDIFYLQNQIKYLFPNEEVFLSWFKDFEDMVRVAPALLDHFDTRGNTPPNPLNRLIKQKGDNKVYLPVDNGYTLRWIKNELIARNVAGPNWNKKIVELNKSQFNNYCIGSPISGANYDVILPSRQSLASYLSNFSSECKKEQAKTSKSLDEEKEETKKSEEIEKESNSRGSTAKEENYKEETQKREETEKGNRPKKEQTGDKKSEDKDNDASTNTKKNISSVKIPNEDTRSLWVWGKADEIIKDNEEQNSFFEFVKAPHGDSKAEINRLYFFGDSLDLIKDRQKIAKFVGSAHKMGVTVEYLTGRPEWVKEGKQQQAASRCQQIVDYNEKVEKSAEFDGIHFDIEPHILDQWEQNNEQGEDKYNDAFENNYMEIMTRCRGRFSSSEDRLTIGVDIPTYFSKKAVDLMSNIDTKESPVDYITVLNYFDTTNKFLNGYSSANFGGVKHNLRLIHHLPVMFGAETQKDVLDKISFGQEGVGDMERAFDATYARYKNHTQFAGLAVHYYKDYKALK